MAGVMYLGSQMVSPVIVQGGGIDTSNYDFIPYIEFNGNSYVDFGDKEKALSSDYCLIPHYDLNMGSFGMGDKATIHNFSATSPSNGILCNVFNGYPNDSYYAWLDEGVTSVETTDEYRFEGFMLLGVEDFVLKANRVIIDNLTDTTGKTYIGQNTQTFQIGSLNLDGYDYNTSSNASLVLNNTYLEVTEDTNNKVFQFYKLEGTLGFFVKAGGLSTYTFTIKTTGDFSDLTFLDNNFYNVSITSRQEGGYYYKDITLTPRTKSELISLGYTEDEADALLALFDETFVDVSKTYEQKGSGIATYYEEDDEYISLPLYILSNISGSLKPTLIEMAQKESISKTQDVLAGNFGVNLLGYITKIGTCFPVIKKDTNTKGFLDIVDGSFYPFVNVTT